MTTNERILVLAQAIQALATATVHWEGPIMDQLKDIIRDLQQKPLDGSQS